VENNQDKARYAHQHLKEKQPLHESKEASFKRYWDNCALTTCSKGREMKKSAEQKLAEERNVER
jgi:hypothetical protein